jgi:hypothetical protein
MTTRSKNRVTDELEPLLPARKRSLGAVRRELRERHLRRLALAAEYGIDVSSLTVDELDALIALAVVEHAPTLEADAER